MAGLLKSISTKKMLMMMMLIMVGSLQIQSSMAQTRHVVGDTLGWTIPTGGASAYSAWASRQTFRVGDTLFFNFTTGNHNVAEVRQAAYGPCTTAGPLSLTTNGPATVALTTAGAHYYICTVGTHCQIGQKLAINVSAQTTTPPAPAPAPTTPPAATPTPTPTPTPSPSPVTPPTPSPTPTPTPAPTPDTTPTGAPTPGDASPPSPPTSGPSPSGSTPSPASDTTPPPPSAATALSFAVPATFLTVALAFFY